MRRILPVSITAIIVFSFAVLRWVYLLPSAAGRSQPAIDSAWDALTLNTSRSSTSIASINNSSSPRITFAAYPSKKWRRSFDKNPFAQVARVTHFKKEFRMFVHDPNECSVISKPLLEKNEWEIDLVGGILCAMANVDGGKGIFIDVGANIGAFTMSVLAHGFPVVSFEPLQYNVELLKASIEAGGFAKNVWLFKTALAAEAVGELCVKPTAHADRNQGNGQLSPVRDCIDAQSSHSSAEVVPVHPMDSMLQSVPRLASKCVSAIKLDVEGFEAQTLLGAAHVMRGACPPCWVVFEYQPDLVQRSGLSATRPLEILITELGYTCYIQSKEKIHNRKHLKRQALESVDKAMKRLNATWKWDNKTHRAADLACMLKSNKRCNKALKGKDCLHYSTTLTTTFNASTLYNMYTQAMQVIRDKTP